MSDAVDFLHADKHESLQQVDTKTFLMGMTKHSQSSQNRKSAMSLQYLKKEVRDEVDFFDADKHQSFLQIDFNTGHQSFLQGDRYDHENVKGMVMGMIKHSQSTQRSWNSKICCISRVN